MIMGLYLARIANLALADFFVTSLASSHDQNYAHQACFVHRMLLTLPFHDHALLGRMQTGSWVYLRLTPVWIAQPVIIVLEGHLDLDRAWPVLSFPPQKRIHPLNVRNATPVFIV